MKKIYKILPVLSIALLMLLAAAGCGSGGDSQDAAGDGNADAGSGQTITITMDIGFPDESGVADIEDAAVTVDEGCSVLNALVTYCNDNDIEVVTDEFSENPYVTGINGVMEDDTAGWTYEVNDEMIMESADACILRDGDEVSWEFESWSE